MTTLVEVRDLTLEYPVRGKGRRAVVHAVDGVTLRVPLGTTLGVVGESGSGKSSLIRCMLRLENPTSGSVIFDGHDITAWSQRQLRASRRQMQMIFQDPIGSLNPRKRIRTILEDTFRVHGLADESLDQHISMLLDAVGLTTEFARKVPAECSGGQAQRVAIARAIALQPKLVVADEPVSALDVSVQAQVLNLMSDLQERLGLTYVIVAHDLGVVRHMADEIAVMYLGKIVERAPADALFARPRHPYTEALLAAIPIPDWAAARSRDRRTPKGEIPSPLNPPSGCRFRTRCPLATGRCAATEPELIARGNDHYVACHYPLGGGAEASTTAPPQPSDRTT